MFANRIFQGHRLFKLNLFLVGLLIITGTLIIAWADTHGAVAGSVDQAGTMSLRVPLDAQRYRIVNLPPGTNPQSFIETHGLENAQVVDTRDGASSVTFPMNDAQWERRHNELCSEVGMGGCENNHCQEFLLPEMADGTILAAATPQVDVETRILETSRSFSRELGVDWGIHGSVQNFSGQPVSGAFATRFDGEPSVTDFLDDDPQNDPAWDPSSLNLLSVDPVTGLFSDSVPLGFHVYIVGVGWEKTEVPVGPAPGGGLHTPTGERLTSQARGTQLTSQPRGPKLTSHPRGTPWITEVPDDIFLSPPPGWPVAPPTEERDRSLPICELKGTKIGFPNTVDYTKLPETPEGQEAVNQPSMTARNIYAHDLSFTEVVTDMYIKNTGVDFELIRTYRSNNKTEQGGYMGYNWEFNYHKRLVPTGGILKENGIKVEEAMFPSPIKYMDGTGRVDLYLPAGFPQVQRVRNYGHDFKAIVQYFKGPKGKFNVLQRYIVLPDSKPPKSLSGHENWEGQIFYVMRYKDDFKEIYSCRGMLLWLKDRHTNFLKFLYDLTFNPVTQNLRLREVRDQYDRKYKFQWVPIDTGSISTNYQGKGYSGPEKIWRLKQVIDFENRTIEYKYKSGDTVPVLEEAIETSGKTLKTRYKQHEYKERYYVDSISYPGSGTITVNKWKIDGDIKRVEQQTFGDGSYGLKRSDGGKKVTISHPDGYKTELKLARAGSGLHTVESTRTSGSGRKATHKYAYNAYDLVTKVEKPEGNTISYEYEGGDKPVSVAKEFYDWVEKRWNWAFNLQGGNVKKTTLSAGKKVNDLSYDSITTTYLYEPLYNQVRRIEGPGEALTEFVYEYDLAGFEGNAKIKKHPKRTLGDGGQLGKIVYTYGYKQDGQTSSAMDPLTGFTSYGYDQFGYLLSISGPSGDISYKRDSRGNMTEFTDERGTSSTYKVNLMDHVEEVVVDSKGFKNKIEFQYDLRSNMTNKITHLKKNVSKGVEIAGLEDRSGTITETFTYDKLNRLTNETLTAGDVSRSRSYTYDHDGNMLTMTSPEGVVATMKYDTQGFMVEKTVGGLKETFEYDLNGSIVTKKAGSGGTTQFETDGYDRPLRTITPLGTLMVEELDPQGNVKKAIVQGRNHAGQDVKLLENEFTFDEFGQRIILQQHILDESGGKSGTRTTKIVRDSMGRVVKKIDANKKPTTYAYNRKSSRLKSETDALGNVVEYAYDPDGNITLVGERTTEVRYNPTKKFARQDFEGYRVSTMTYDSLGRMIKMTMPGDQEVQYAYDSLGKVIGAQYKNGRRDIFKLDGLGRVKEEKQFANLTNGTVTIERKHDLLDRETSMKATRAGKVISSVSRKFTPYGKVKEKTVNGVTTKYTFDDRGLLKKEELPNGFSVTYSYDQEGRMIKLSADSGISAGTQGESFEYDGLHRITKASRYGGFVTNKVAYDSLGNILSDEQSVKGHAFKFQYEYDTMGMKKTMKVPKLIADTSAQTFTYERDVLGRVTKVGRSGTFPSDRYGGMEYEYTGFSRIARRTIGGNYHTYYDYSTGGEVTSYAVANGKTEIIKNQMRHKNGLPSNVATSMALPGDYSTSQMLEPTYSSDMKVTQTSFAESFFDRPSKTFGRSATTILNSYSGGKLDSVFTYMENTTNAPGAMWGRNKAKMSTGSKVKYTYSGDRISSTAFHKYGDVDIGILDVVGDTLSMMWNVGDTEKHDLGSKLQPDAVTKIMSGRGSLVETNSFRHDELGNVTSDGRYRYTYDYRNQLTDVTDSYTFGHNFESNATYYYDFKNRLVYIEYGPRAARPYFETVRSNLRILYDGKLPHAELKTDADAKPLRVENWYETHPEGPDIGYARSRTYYDIRGDTGNQISQYYPFFDPNGQMKLALDLDSKKFQQLGFLYDSLVRRTTHKKHTMLHRFNKKTKSTDMFALKSDQARSEVPLTGLHTRWMPLPGLNYNLMSGRFHYNYNRNFKGEHKQLINAQSDYLAEVINEGHKTALIAMGLAVLPVAVAAAPMAMAKIILADLVVDLVITKAVMGKKYGLSHLGTALALSPVFFAGGHLFLEFRHLKTAKVTDAIPPRTITEAPRAARKADLMQSMDDIGEGVASSADNVGREVAEDLSKPIIPELYDNPPIQPMRKASQQNKHGVMRHRFWQANPWIRDLVHNDVINLIADMADDGFKWAEDFLDDFVNERVKYIFYADHKHFGSFNEATAAGILKISPFGRKMTLRDTQEIASTIIHEYMHFRGYNEFTAHWVQFKFMMRVMAKKPAIAFPAYAAKLQAFQTVMNVGGRKQAARWMVHYIVDRGYNLAHYGGSRRSFIRGVSNFGGGRYKEIEAVLKTGFFPKEFIPKTLRGS